MEHNTGYHDPEPGTGESRVLQTFESLLSKDDIHGHFKRKGRRFSHRRIANAMREGEHYIISRRLYVKPERIDDIFEKLLLVPRTPQLPPSNVPCQTATEVAKD